MKIITLIIPCFNEQEVLNLFYKEVSHVTNAMTDISFRFLFINDGSKDHTLDILKELSQNYENVSYLSLSRNFGKEAAMLAGLDYAEGDAVIIMDADLQHPPEMIPDMVKYWKQGYDDVCAKRKNRKDEGRLKRCLTQAFYSCISFLSKVPMQQNVGDFRLMDRRCVASLRLLRESQRYTKGIFTWIGYRKKEIPFEVQARAAGKTTWNYFSLVNLALEGITSFTTVPLRLTTCLGLLISVLAICYMFFVVINALLYGDPVAGYPTLMTVMLFLGGVQLLSLGIIGEYLGRIFNESKNRPLYLIDEYDGKPVTYFPDIKPVERNFRIANKNKEESYE